VVRVATTVPLGLVTVINAPARGHSGSLYRPLPFISLKARTHRPPMRVVVGVLVGVAVFIGVRVGVLVATAVGVGVLVSVGATVDVGVDVEVLIGVGVDVLVAVA